MMRPCHECRPAGLRLAASPAVLAMMLALQPQTARAQAFQGRPTVILGSVDRVTGAGTETLNVAADQNTINWLPSDNGPGPAPINFLPAGSVATFVSVTGAPYTVLNRIIAADPSRAIQFAGTVTSDPIGHIWFYAPGGLLLTGTAQFNVGSLLLTANDPVGAAAGQPYLDPFGNFRLTAAPDSRAGISIRSGAQINALADNAYVIAVAPRFDMAGSITVNGSAALAALEDASFTLNGGLFDITANIGSAAGGTSSVTGTITGPAGISGQSVFHRIYLMAVPKNDAMTLLISGGAQIGFEIAAAADVDGNAIILSGGYDIKAATAGEGVGQFGQLPVAGSVGEALVAADNASFTSSVTVRSKDRAEVQASSGGLGFASNLAVFADELAMVRAVSGQLLLAAGDIRADASTYANLFAGASRSAGVAEVSASTGGSISAQGNILALANGAGEGTGIPLQPGGTGTGGSALIGALGGNVRATSLTVAADGVGGASLAGRGGSAVGGVARVQLDATGSMVIGQDISVTANANANIGGPGQQSGSASGGTATVVLAAGLALPGNLVIAADATYSGRASTAHVGGGAATAGTAALQLLPGSVVSANFISISAAGIGTVGAGGNAFAGGSASLQIDDAGGTTSLAAANGLVISASALAADGSVNGNPDGGSATGGFARIIASGNPQINISAGNVDLRADAVAGNGAPGLGGTALGGRAHVDFQGGGSLRIAGRLGLSANATGGSGTLGGNATAYDAGDGAPPAVLLNYGGGATAADLGITVGSAITLSASALGGTSDAGIGGAARGGLVVMTAASAGIAAQAIGLDAAADGGFGQAGGAARSGRLFIKLADAGLTSQTDLAFNVNATGGTAFGRNGGRGGDATIGQVSFTQSATDGGPGSTVDIRGSSTVAAAARGGNGDLATSGSAGNGGNAFGADPNAPQPAILIGVQSAGSRFTTGMLTIDNMVFGGAGGVGSLTANGGNGGRAVGGRVSIGAVDGTVIPVATRPLASFGSLAQIQATVTGGAGGIVDGSGLGGRGGDAIGGTGLMVSRGGVVTASTVIIDTSAQGGAAGGAASDLGGGTAIGGHAGVLATPDFNAGLPADLNVKGAVTLLATARGGASRATPGNAVGGLADVLLQLHEQPGAAAAGSSGVLAIDGPLEADASAIGGDSLLAGVNGGAGTGGIARLANGRGTLALSGPVTLLADGSGGGVAAPGDSAGTGTGGVAEISFDGGSASISGPTLALRASGRFGAATGGSVRIAGGPLGGDLLVDVDDVSLDASARAGDQFGQPGAGNAAGGSIDVTSGPGGTLRLRNPGVAGALTLLADGIVANLGRDVTASASGGRISLTALGNLNLNAPGLNFSAIAVAGVGGMTVPGGRATGGSVQMLAQGGNLALVSDNGSVSVQVDARAGYSDVLPGAANGGQISIAAVGGTISTNAELQLQLGATAGASAAVAPGDATGGTASLSLAQAGVIDIGGALRITHSLSGQNVRGGNSSITSTGGRLATGGDLVLASGVQLVAPVAGGQARGGDILIAMADGDDFSIGGALIADTSAQAFGSAPGRSLAGGTITWDHRGSGSVAGQTFLQANARFFEAASGTATAGSIRATVRSGSLTLADTSLLATASAGSLASGAPPLATAGTLVLASDAGAVATINGKLAMTADGAGAGNANGAAGSGLGGSITLASAGTINLNPAGQSVRLLANGLGGTSFDAGGGAGQGGSISISTAPGGRLIVNDPIASPFIIEARGQGGDGPGTGGTGQGGTVQMVLAGVATSLSGDLAIKAMGTGGAGSSGAGGDGSGGAITVAARGGTGTIAGAGNLMAGGVAGAGAAAATGRGGSIDLGSAAGNGTPGSLTFGGAIMADASGTGSNAGGTPGQAGAVRLFARGGSQFSLASLTSTASGTSPVFALRGGLLADQGSTLSIVGDALVSSGVDLGLNDGGIITAGGVLQMTAGGQVLAAFATPATGGIGTVTAGQLEIDAGSGVTLATTLGGGSSVFVRGLGPVTLGMVASGGDIGLVARSTLTSGALNSGRDLVLLAGGTVTTGALATPATGRVRIGDFAQQGLISYSASGPDYSALFAAAPAAVPGDIAIGGAVTTGLFDANATGLLRVTGTINAAIGARLSGNALQLADANSQGVLDLTSATSVVLGNLVVTGTLSVTSGGSITTGNITTGQSLLLVASRPGAALATGNIRSDGEIRLVSATTLASGSLSAGNRVLLDAGGALTTAAIDAGTVNPAAGAAGVLSATALGPLSTGPISVAASATLAGSLVTLNGNLASPTTTITAGDIVIAAGSVIGGGVATSLTLVVDPASRAAVIGGAGVATPGTYSLSNAEFGTLRADTITVQTAAGTMTVDTLALAAVSPATGLATSQINLISGGVLRVTGAVTMAQAGPQNRLALTSGSRIEVVQGSGSVRLGAGIDRPIGTLALTAPRLWVASDSLLSQLASGQLAGPARDSALNAAGTPVVTGGSIGAGTIQISAGNEVLIQNSGTRQLPAGFTTGAGGLVISRAGQGNVLIDVVINGRIQLKDDSFATGRDTVGQVQFTPGTLAANSQVNGCVIGGRCAGVLPDEVSQPVLTIVNTVKALTPEELARREVARAATERLPIVMLQRLIDYGPLFADPDANDPVTSGGNPALWREPDPRRSRAPGGQK